MRHSAHELRGLIGGSKVYKVRLPTDEFLRLVELTESGASVPDWLEVEPSVVLGQRWIVTSQPEWFAEKALSDE